MFVVLGNKVVNTASIDLIIVFRRGDSSVTMASGRIVELNRGETETLLRALGVNPEQAAAQAEEAWDEMEQEADWGDPPAW